ncbi:hypothetical protein Tco_1524740 [Tanacetum coccineum]
MWGDTVFLIRRRVSNNLPYIRVRLHFTVIATVKKISSTTIDKASINHQKSDTVRKLREFHICVTFHSHCTGYAFLNVPGATVEPPRLDATSVGSSEDADVAGAESEAGEVDSGLKRKRATSDDGAGTVEATSDSFAPVTHAVQSLPQTSPLTTDDISRRDRETSPKAFEGTPVDLLMEEFDMVTAQQAALVAQLRAKAEAESFEVYAQKLAIGKIGNAYQGLVISHGMRLAALRLWNLSEDKQELIAAMETMEIVLRDCLIIASGA